MTASLAAIRAAVRADLRDGTALSYTDAQLDRAIAEAVNEYGRARPRQYAAELLVSGRGVDLQAAAPAGLGATVYGQLIRVAAVEHPTGLYPPAYKRFDRWGPALTLHSDRELGGEEVKVYAELVHTLTSTESTVPLQHAELVALGAAGFAQRQLAAEAAVSLTINPNQAAHLRELALERLARFRAQLRGAIRQSALYRPENPYLSRDVAGFPE